MNRPIRIPPSIPSSPAISARAGGASPPGPPLHGARPADHGVGVRGDMVWSLPDKLEWSAGHARRFGIVHVDRAPRHAYLAATGGACLKDEE